ncbi:MAG: V4R domain-containing protein [Candidatus Helarchaeota archaeon]
MIKRSVIPFGLASLDKLLGGGLSPGCAILIISEHPSTRKTAFMGYFALEQLLKDRGKVFVIEYLYPPHQFYQLPDFLTSPSFFQEITKKKRYIILNCYGKVEFPPEFKFKESIQTMSSPHDLSKVRYEIERLRREHIPEGVNARWIFDDITSMIVTVGDENKVLKFVRDIFHFLRKTGDLGLFYIERRAHSVQLMTALEDLAGAIISLNVKEIGDSLIPHLRVIKNRGFGSDIISAEVPYILTHKGISLKTEVLEDFETIKKYMSISKDGIIKLFGSEFLVLPKIMYTKILKKLFESTDYLTYNETLYKAGKLAGKQLYPFFSNIIRTRTQFTPADLINILNSFGIGKVEVLKMELRRGILQVRVHNLARWETNKPIHSVVAGLITSCLELFTKDQWDCIEIKCNAIGYSKYCDFIATPAEKLKPLIYESNLLKNNLRIDKNGIINIEMSRSFLISDENLRLIIDSIEKLTDKKQSSEIQYNLGRQMAIQFGNYVSKKLKLEGEAIFNFWAKIANSKGWGSFHLEYFSPERKRAHLFVENTIIGSVKNKSGEIVDHLTAGLIAGIFECITNEKVICKEVKCINKGDPICEFIVKPFNEIIPK